jgi:hypothetical protein
MWPWLPKTPWFIFFVMALKKVEILDHPSTLSGT